ncbi:MAG TPA: DUF2330 domain-containing protein [Polyangiaceae bacterium]|nr:DUF2330 domain-containing protein [Polyangiaceae bacterium]
MRFSSLAGSGLAALLSIASISRDASACGACFTTPPQEGQGVPSVVTSHRMALSISTSQTILWDQIRYAGSPSEFAWVLPVKPGARIDVATDAWFDVLEAATSPIVMPPELDCSTEFDCSVSGPLITRGTTGCAADDEASSANVLPQDDGVDVVSHGSAGPYEVVTLHADEPDALPKWLASHDYALPDEMAPVISDYAKDGYDFIALRLLPSAGIQQMRPVRVVMDGAVPALPLRMVAAGTGASTAITLFVIGEGRWEVSNFGRVVFPEQLLEWDFPSNSSTYGALREQFLAANDQGFFTQYAKRGALFGRVINPFTNAARTYQTSNGWRNETIADAYVQQGFVAGESSSTDCQDRMVGLGFDARRVVDPCDGAEDCRSVDPSSEIDARDLMCDPPLGSDYPLDDLALALVGLHPKDVWVTRLEARLGRAAFQKDLELGSAEDQSETAGIFQATIAKDAPCDLAATPPGQRPERDERPRPPGPRPSATWGVGLGLALLSALALVRRSRTRRRRGARPLGARGPIEAAGGER